MFLYAWLVPLGVWGFMTWRQSTARHMSAYSFLETVCVYGYSLFMYIPTSVSLEFQHQHLETVPTCLVVLENLSHGQSLTFIDLKLEAFLNCIFLPIPIPLKDAWPTSTFHLIYSWKSLKALYTVRERSCQARNHSWHLNMSLIIMSLLYWSLLILRLWIGNNTDELSQFCSVDTISY